MKKVLLLIAVLCPLGAWAQTSSEWGARVSAEANCKIARGTHIYVEEEIRSRNASLDDIRTTLAFTYKPFKRMKLGVGYTLIHPNQASTGTFKAPRHRLFADVAYTVRAGEFHLTLKERFQFTHRCGDFNVYQNTPNALALKSKFTVKYKGWFAVEPYASFELRTALNDPWGTASGTAQWNKEFTKSYYDYTPTGYTHVYNNRYRGELGINFEVTREHTLKPYLLLDYCVDYELDTNAKGTHLYTAAYENTFCLSLGLGYVYSF